MSNDSLHVINGFRTRSAASLCTQTLERETPPEFRGDRILRYSDLLSDRDAMEYGIDMTGLPHPAGVEIRWALARVMLDPSLSESVTVYGRGVRMLLRHLRSLPAETSLLALDPGEVAAASTESRERYHDQRPLTRMIRALFVVLHERVEGWYSPNEDPLLPEIDPFLRDARQVHMADLPMLSNRKGFGTQPLMGLHPTVRIELLWAMSDVARTGLGLVSAGVFKKLILAAETSPLRSLVDRPLGAWMDYIETCTTSEKTKTRYRNATFRFLYPLYVARERDEREWWEQPVWGVRYDRRMPLGFGTQKEVAQLDLRRFQLPWLREAFRWWASRSIIRGKRATHPFIAQMSVIINHIEPWLIENTNGAASLLDDGSEEAFRNLATRMWDSLSERLGSSFEYRPPVTNMLSEVYAERRAAEQALGQDLSDLPEWFVYWLREEPRLVGRKSRRRAVDEVDPLCQPLVRRAMARQ